MTNYLKYIALVICTISCKDPFEPPVTSEQVNFLVVDGMMDASDGTARIKLSRANKLSSSENFPIVSDALVSIEDQNNVIFAIPYADSGIYRLAGINFKSENKYRLLIQDSNGKKYSSDFRTILKVPEIDTLFWEPSQDGLRIKINTRSDQMATRFYKWNFIETWQYTAPIESFLVIDANQNVDVRLPKDQLYNCWISKPSPDILIRSTDLSGENRVDDFQLTFLPIGTDKLIYKYSIFVQQISLTEDAYQYWDQVKKTTQNLGGLFDPLPSTVTGNISSDSDPNEVVLGFFYGGYTRTKRISIVYHDLPAHLQVHPKSTWICSQEAIPFSGLASRDPSLVIIASYGIPTKGYIFSTPRCVDCRAQGGTNVKPSFW